MAGVLSLQDGIVLSMSPLEQLASWHVDVPAHWSQVVSVVRVDDVSAQVHGERAPILSLLGRNVLGTMRRGDELDFCAVYGSRPGFVITLKDHEFSRILVSS